MDFILGTNSPRRKEIFSFFSIPYRQVSSTFEERSVPFNGDPNRYVLDISDGKVNDLSSQHPSATILTADTAVFCNGEVYGKPNSEEHALETLMTLNGKPHTVVTGLSLYHEGKTHTVTESTEVLFNTFTEEQARQYIHNLTQKTRQAPTLSNGLALLSSKRSMDASTM